MFGSRTDAKSKGNEPDSGEGVLDQVRTAGTQQSGAGLVVLTVVSGIEAVRYCC